MADDDIDNMDFDLPSELLTNIGNPSFSSGMPTLQAMGQRADPRVLEASKRWTCIYPVYIDQDKSYAEGRRVSKSQAVKNPAAIYMAEAVQRLGLTSVVEPKCRHPRDPFTFGRIRVQIHTTAGKPISPIYFNKRQLLIKIASMLPACKEELDQSDSKIAGIAAHSRSELSKTVEEASQPKSVSNAITSGSETPAIAASSTVSSTSSKKKGKKKR
ncbi:hypothetical protein BATDEDRAFT_25645 [Batrachochytrium dendrobatidis JAM81]|uniref:SRP19 protein n=2 Tax=Batrachochytrium dendrobatidis TaxID=109871 RepID=F4P4I0_BATDJ|nr:uncharacterized protein BATDEDRAFT_25645 [Batrachochytrium dendrobatidis JAM81]EGF79818.1 hypothetical protein BATDEDRAFT_25645 [Batrachochytrium dendrobatidis JAM81]KAJ8324988.1 signal recognition particle subunit [Batrachochytrium dendrobatidis]KAK5672771.1 signal recognition particle subunit [Batrachochytrium dendrobatidis]OAJ39081.1 SRP19 protein [Batrachochytrium dendrobatidis JEL423]|eukprot:XP_006679494.1 hypothetical protein BATDEDRAFT_25645 [Batrachochytrium dendrobatidis JAM81]